MEIIIHGTKGGYKVLFQTPNVPFSIAWDARRVDRNDENPVGQTAYSIAFAENGCVYSKYLIVRDIERAAVGNIAFSVYIPNNKKLVGNDVKELLDQLEGAYKYEYITNGNLGNKQEDWVFVNANANLYGNRLQPVVRYDTGSIMPGTGIPAFVYYTSDEELQKYFDAPYREEYSKFRQVFFVQSDLQNNPQNPLNALRHDTDADLTGKIDFSKKDYTQRQIVQPTYYPPITTDKPIPVAKEQHSSQSPSREYRTIKTDNNDNKKENFIELLYKNPKFIAGGVVAILLIIIATLFTMRTCNSDPKPDPNPPVNDTLAAIKQQIETYVQGIELNSNTLKNYKTQYCGNRDTSFYSYCSQLENALAIRQAINNGDIDELKSRITELKGSEQAAFKNTIANINETYKNDIKTQMRSDDNAVSTMNLNQIAKYITDLQKLLQIQNEITTITEIEDLEIKKAEINQITQSFGNRKTGVVTAIDKKITAAKKAAAKKEDPKPKDDEKPVTDTLGIKNGGDTQTNWETEFWDLVYKENVKKEDFYNWAVKYQKNGEWSTLPSEYKRFYNMYLSKNTTNITEKSQGYVTFGDGFKKIPYMARQVSKDTEGLKKLKELITK